MACFSVTVCHRKYAAAVGRVNIAVDDGKRSRSVSAKSALREPNPTIRTEDARVVVETDDLGIADVMRNVGTIGVCGAKFVGISPGRPVGDVEF